MMTSQVKKGNSARRGKTFLRISRHKKDTQRRQEAGLPYCPPHLMYECPHCGTSRINVENGHTRTGNAAPVCAACRGTVPEGIAVFHEPYPKKRQQRRDED